MPFPKQRTPSALLFGHPLPCQVNRKETQCKQSKKTWIHNLPQSTQTRVRRQKKSTRKNNTKRESKRKK
jgi:hypothetical protein